MKKLFYLQNINLFYIISFTSFLFFSLNYHIYNTISYNAYVILSIIYFFFLIFFFVKSFLKIKQYLFVYIFFVIIFFIFYFLNLNNADISNIKFSTKLKNVNNLLTYISFFYPVFFFGLILLFVPIFLKSNEATIKKQFLVVNIICLFLLTISLLCLIFDQILINYSGHHNWGRPFMYLFFFNDNESSKLQHAYILFISSYFIFFDYFNEKKTSIKNLFLITINIFYIYLIFSLLFWGITIIYIFFLFLFSKNKIYFLKKGLSIIGIFLIMIFFLLNILSFKNTFIAKTYKGQYNSFSFIDVTSLKLAKILYFLDFGDNKLIYKAFINENNLVIKYSNLNYFKNIQNSEQRLNKSINHFNSTEARKITLQKCFNKNFFKSQYFNSKFSNCESAIASGNYLFGISFLIWFFLLILIFIFKNRSNAKSLFFIFLFTLISCFHLTFENTFSFVIISYFISQTIKKQTLNFSKLDS